VAQSVHRVRQQQRHIEHAHEEEREREQHAEGTRRARVGAPEEVEAAIFSYLMRDAIRMHSACAHMDPANLTRDAIRMRSHGSSQLDEGRNPHALGEALTCFQLAWQEAMIPSTLTQIAPAARAAWLTCGMLVSSTSCSSKMSQPDDGRNHHALSMSSEMPSEAMLQQLEDEST